MPEDTDQPQPDSAPDSDAPQEQPAQPMFPQVSVNLDAEGLHVFMMPAPMNVGIEPAVMDALCRDWLAKRPELFTALLNERIEQVKAAQSRLQLVREPKAIALVNRSRNRRQA